MAGSSAVSHGLKAMAIVTASPLAIGSLLLPSVSAAADVAGLAAVPTSRYRSGSSAQAGEPMHELSIIQNVVEAATEAAQSAGASRVTIIRLRVGVLAGVVKESLLFCHDVATRGTLLEGSQLLIEELPVVIECAHCGCARTLVGIQNLRCPVCQTPAQRLLQGREMEIENIEIEIGEESDEAPVVPGPAADF